MPATAASADATMKTRSFTPYGRMPMTRTRSSFSRVASATCPARLCSTQSTTR